MNDLAFLSVFLWFFSLFYLSPSVLRPFTFRFKTLYLSVFIY